MAKKVEKNIVKKNVIVSYNKIDNDLKMALLKEYPDGYGNYIIRYPKPNGEYFFAVPLDTDEANYLIKVEVKVDNLITEDDFDKQFGDIAEVESKTVIGEDEADDSDDDEEAEDEAEGDDEDDDDDE
ncbi:MAG: hypothetical protein LBU91_07565 [Bacteroidales bacterium]|jgi:hypothetical protein|nr:hypothetical protein [Bacteroidales bacterium]